MPARTAPTASQLLAFASVVLTGACATEPLVIKPIPPPEHHYEACCTHCSDHLCSGCSGGVAGENVCVEKTHAAVCTIREDILHCIPEPDEPAQAVATRE